MIHPILSIWLVEISVLQPRSYDRKSVSHSIVSHKKGHDKIFIDRTKGKKKLCKLLIAIYPCQLHSLCKPSSLQLETWILVQRFSANTLLMVNPGNGPKEFKILWPNNLTHFQDCIVPSLAKLGSNMDSSFCFLLDI